jgi:hypothetical protein
MVCGSLDSRLRGNDKGGWERLGRIGMTGRNGDDKGEGVTGWNGDGMGLVLYFLRGEDVEFCEGGEGEGGDF